MKLEFCDGTKDEEMVEDPKGVQGSGVVGSADNPRNRKAACHRRDMRKGGESRNTKNHINAFSEVRSN